MSSWLLFALLGHVANGVAFVVDKALLRNSFRHPATYACLIGVLGSLAVVLLPFGVAMPDATGWTLIVLSGSTFILSLWLFFTALSRGEASRVIPVIGSLIPLITLGGSMLFLGERLTGSQLSGFALLVAATAILSGGKGKGRLAVATLGTALLAALLFAFSSVTAKAAYDAHGFLSVFTFSRLVGLPVALFLLTINAGARTELWHALRPKASESKRRTAAYALPLVLLAQTLGALGFVGVHYATSLGSVALVNALQAVQYAMLVLIGLVLARRAPHLLGEDVRPAVIARKLFAIALVGIGLWLIV